MLYIGTLMSLIGNRQFLIHRFRMEDELPV